MRLFPLNQPKGPEATRLRLKRQRLLREFRLPENALLGSLSLSHTRCGKPTCHCAEGQGHPRWQFTFMVDGTKRVESVPAAWVEEIRRRAEAGRVSKDALTELFATNAELWVLERKHRGKKRTKTKDTKRT